MGKVSKCRDRSTAPAVLLVIPITVDNLRPAPAKEVWP